MVSDSDLRFSVWKARASPARRKVGCLSFCLLKGLLGVCLHQRYLRQVEMAIPHIRHLFECFIDLDLCLLITSDAIKSQAQVFIGISMKRIDINDPGVQSDGFVELPQHSCQGGGNAHE